MAISTEAEKAFEKFQYPFMINTLQNMSKEGTYLNIIKAIYEKPRTNIILKGEKLKAFPLRSGKDKAAFTHCHSTVAVGDTSIQTFFMGECYSQTRCLMTEDCPSSVNTHSLSSRQGEHQGSWTHLLAQACG